MHVERDELDAKFWLDPVRFEWSSGLGRSELRRIEAVLRENQALLLREWYEYFGN